MIKLKHDTLTSGVEITFDGDNGPESFIMGDSGRSSHYLNRFEGVRAFPIGIWAAFQTVNNMGLIREIQAWEAKQENLRRQRAEEHNDQDEVPPQ